LTDYPQLLEFASIAFALLMAFPNLIINLEDRKKEEWILNFYRFVATKLLVPSVAYLSSAFMTLAYIHTEVEIFGELSCMLLIVTTFGLLCFIVVGLTYAEVKVIIERSVEREVVSREVAP